MKDKELSRRQALSVAGAGIVALSLTGCKDENSTQAAPLSPNDISKSVGKFIADRGLGHGHNPNEGPKPSPSPVAFEPSYMVVVHLTSDGNWDIKSNHAHFHFTDQNRDNRIKRARDILLNKKNNSRRRFRDENSNADYKVFDRNGGIYPRDFADELQFDAFTFLSQHDIYLFYEHKKGELGFDVANNRLVEFSRTHNDGTPTKENYAFFNAELIQGSALLGDLEKLGSLIRLENFYTVWDGTNYTRISQSANGPQDYKIDFIYVPPSGIAMAVDPDTGNGYGNGP